MSELLVRRLDGRVSLLVQENSMSKLLHGRVSW